jgi:uncharacterized protein YbjT (DUF2867 family)
MKQLQKIAVIGGAGRTGQYVVKQLLEKGFHISLLLRNPDMYTLSNPSVEVIKGDVLDAGVVNRLIGGCDAVISTVGQRKGEPLVASAATTNILNAMERTGCREIRYVLLAGLNVDTPSDKKGPQTQEATDWMKATFPEIHEDRQRAYAILDQSPLNWTLVRVPFIEFNDERRDLKVSLTDCPGAKIGAADIAAFLIAQLTGDSYLRKVPFISS